MGLRRSEMETTTVLAYRFKAFGYELAVRESEGGWIGRIVDVKGKFQTEIGPGTLEDMKAKTYAWARADSDDVEQNWQPTATT
jgi:hypothetical protein